MKRLNFNLNSSLNNEDIIKEISPFFKDLTITKSNLIDALTYLAEKDNCKNCKSLDMCKNHQLGYIYNYKNQKFSFTPCKYLIEHNSNLRKNDLFKVFYYPESTKLASISDFYNTTEDRKKLIRLHNKYIKEYPLSKCSNLLLIGRNNCGKTYFLSTVCNSFSEIGVSSSLVYVPDLALNIKNSFSDPTKLDAIINHLKTVDVLCLDDIGAEVRSEWFRDEILGSIINLRSKDNKLTLYSTNLTPDQLKEFYAFSLNDVGATRLFNRITDNTLIFKMDN